MGVRHRTAQHCLYTPTLLLRLCIPYSGKLSKGGKKSRFYGYSRKFLREIWRRGVFWWHQCATRESFLRENPSTINLRAKVSRYTVVLRSSLSPRPPYTAMLFSSMLHHTISSQVLNKHTNCTFNTQSPLTGIVFLRLVFVFY